MSKTLRDTSLTVDEVAHLLETSAGHAAELIANGHLPYFETPGGDARVNVIDVIEFADVLSHYTRRAETSPDDVDFV